MIVEKEPSQLKKGEGSSPSEDRQKSPSLESEYSAGEGAAQSCCTKSSTQDRQQPSTGWSKRSHTAPWLAVRQKSVVEESCSPHGGQEVGHRVRAPARHTTQGSLRGPTSN